MLDMRIKVLDRSVVEVVQILVTRGDEPFLIIKPEVLLEGKTAGEAVVVKPNFWKVPEKQILQVIGAGTLKAVVQEVHGDPGSKHFKSFNKPVPSLPPCN
jgi:hypothetical protein